MRLLYGTSNQAKLVHMRDMLSGLGIEIAGLKDIGIDIDVEESGNNPLENARLKAVAYYEMSHIPTFSCDSGLYIEGLKDSKQPGVNVRRVNGKYLNDDEFIEYYVNLLSEVGGEPKAKFKNAICLVLDENRIFEYDGDDIADHIILTSKVHPKRKKGFPMDSISIDIETGKYIVDEYENGKNEREITQGFRDFFTRAILNNFEGRI